MDSISFADISDTVWHRVNAVKAMPLRCFTIYSRSVKNWGSSCLMVSASDKNYINLYFLYWKPARASSLVISPALHLAMRVASWVGSL